jgi:hypothetical protein
MARLNFFRAENIFALQQKPGQAAIFSALTTPILAPTVSKGTRSAIIQIQNRAKNIKFFFLGAISKKFCSNPPAA